MVISEFCIFCNDMKKFGGPGRKFGKESVLIFYY